MQRASALAILPVAFAGSSLISHMPRLLEGSSLFLFSFQLFSFQLFFNWIYRSVRSFGHVDSLTVCIILFSVILFGFRPGILAGILLTVFLFVMGYSMISASQKKYTLLDQRSSVKRAASASQILNRHGHEALACSLQGYLFFGTANTIRDAAVKDINSGLYHPILLDICRVTGVHIAALNVVSRIRQIGDQGHVILASSNVTADSGSPCLIWKQ